jgi:hypothetical protein
MAMALATTSCDDADHSNTTTHEDTAVLVTDPNNNLEASPVNDTTVADTVHNDQQ